jgi:hypothetical protein
MQTRCSTSVSSDTISPFNEYPNYHERVESCSSRSSSPWSAMTPSAQGDDDVEMTDSPASSYASIEQPFPTSPCAGESGDVTSELSSGSSTTVSVYVPPSSYRLNPFSDAERKAAKNAHLVLKERERVARAARVKELKHKALSISNKDRPNKAPAPDHQREVLRLVFDQITPYPDEAWISQLALHFDWYAASNSPILCMLLNRVIADTTKSKTGFQTIVRRMRVNTGLFSPRANMTLPHPFAKSLAKVVNCACALPHWSTATKKHGRTIFSTRLS